MLQAGRDQCPNGLGFSAMRLSVNRETETIVATGVILTGIPYVDKIDIDKIKSGYKLVVDADEATVEIE